MSTAQPPTPQAPSLHLDLLRHLGKPALVLDPQERALWWNREFLELFPEHDGHLHVGEPYAENLRRFYRARLDPQELAHMERYVADGLDRHRRQISPYEFLHRHRWLRVEMLALPGIGHLRMWTPASPPRDGDTLAARMVESGKHIDEGDLDQLVDGLVVRDAKGRILSANRRVAELYGLGSARDAIGKTLPDLLDHCWRNQAAAGEAQQRWADNSRYPGAPFELPLPGDRWVRVREHRTHDGGTIGTHVDVTDLWRLQRSAIEARQRAEELAAMLGREIAERKRAEAQRVQVARLVSLGQMATGLAHELNQPLAIMSLAADNAALALQRRGSDAIPEALDRLETIVTAALRARGVVDHLRIFGRDDDGEAPAQPVELGEVVKGALTLSGAAIRSAGIALSVTLPDPPPWVLGQLIPLEQVVVNLLLNARDALLDTGQPDGTIRLEVGRQEGKVTITVADNGGGFSPAALQHALEPFFTTKDAGKGTGLGLSLTYSTVSAMGGSIHLENAGGGAVVRVVLPAHEPTQGHA